MNAKGAKMVTLSKRNIKEATNNILSLSTDGLVNETIISSSETHQLYLQGDKNLAISLIRDGNVDVDASMSITYEYEKHCEPHQCGFNQDTYDWSKTVHYEGVTLLQLAIQHGDLEFAAQLVALGADVNTTINCQMETYTQMHTVLGEPVNWDKECFDFEVEISIIESAISNESAYENLVFLKQAGFDFKNISQNDHEMLDDYCTNTNNMDIALFMYENCDWEDKGVNVEGLLMQVICEQEDVPSFWDITPQAPMLNDVMNMEKDLFDDIQPQTVNHDALDHVALQATYHVESLSNQVFDQVIHPDI